MAFRYRISPRHLALILLAALTAAVCGALPLSQLLPDADDDARARLLAGEALTLDATETQNLRLLPATAAGEVLRPVVAREKPAFLVESAYLFRGKEIRDRLALYNALTAFRTMSGITYFSFNRNRETVLYSDVYRTQAPGSRRALPDTPAESLPVTSGFDIHIKDVNFGSTWYALTVETGEGEFAFAMQNTQPIGIFVMRAFGVGRLRTRFQLCPVDEGILVYGVCLADPVPASAKFVDMYWAIAKRLDAVREWTVVRIGTLP